MNLVPRGAVRAYRENHKMTTLSEVFTEEQIKSGISSIQTNVRFTHESISRVSIKNTSTHAIANAQLVLNIRCLTNGWKHMWQNCILIWLTCAIGFLQPVTSINACVIIRHSQRLSDNIFLKFTVED